MKKIMLLAMIASSAVFARELIVTPVVGVNYSFLSAKSINSAVLGREAKKEADQITKFDGASDKIKTAYSDALFKAIDDKLSSDDATKTAYKAIKDGTGSGNIDTTLVDPINKILKAYGDVESKNQVSTSTAVNTFFTFKSNKFDNSIADAEITKLYSFPETDSTKLSDQQAAILNKSVPGLDVKKDDVLNDETMKKLEDIFNYNNLQVVADKDDAKKDSINSFGAKIGLEVKTPVYEQDKVRFLVGGAVSGNFAFTGNETIGTYTSLFVAPVAEVEYKVNDDMSVFGNVQPGIGVGLFKSGKNLAFNLDGTLGVKYDSFRIGVNGGARFLKGYKGMVTNGYIGATVGYDISFDLGE